MVQFARVQGLFREAVLALWAADHADLKFGRALIRAIHARRLLALVADERVVGMFAVSRLARAPRGLIGSRALERALLWLQGSHQDV